MPAFLLSPLLRWAVVGVLVAVLAGWAYTEYRLRIGADAERDAALSRADLASQDAARWKAASDLRDQANAVLVGNLKEQSDATDKERFAREQADRAAAKAEADSRDARASFDARMSEIEAEAVKTPGDVRPLGPIVTRRIPQLWQ
jgi:hypothetical protein